MVRFYFDAMSRRIKRTLPGGQSETFGYDAVGNVIAQTNFNGLAITNGYSAMNRLLVKATVLGVALANYAYSATGQRTNMVDASGTTSYVYDSRDRLRTNATPQGRLSYGYDSNGNVTNIQSGTANGASLAYQYDALNRLTNVFDSRLSGTASSNTVYGFDAVGNLQSLTYPNGVTNQYQYDSLNRLLNLAWKSNATTIASFAYQLGLAGNRTKLSETLNGSNRTNSWGYDSLYRLTNETVSGAAPTGTLGYSYDQVANRTIRSGTLGSITATNYTYGSNDWLSTDVYDSDGNTRTNGANRYLYDWADRLTNYVNGTTNLSIVYNADGQRVSKTIGTATTLYLVDERNPSGYAQVLEELSASGGTTNLVRVYSYGLDLISQRQISRALTTFYGYDGLGSTRFLAGTNGAVTDTYAFDAYGTLIASTGSTTNFYLYAGEQFDRELRLNFHRARYLITDTGRFLTRDNGEGGGNEDPLSLHTYLYAGVNPVSNRDPSGHDTVETLSVAAIQSGLYSMALGAPVRAYHAAVQFRAGVDLGTILYDASIGVLTDGAIGAALPGLGAFASRIAPLARITQVGGQIVGRAVNSVWNLSPFVRGRAIEQAILGRIPSLASVPSFPVIDDFYQGVATSVKSLDLAAATYQNTGALASRLSGYAKALSGFTGKTWGGAVVDGAKITDRVLLVAIEPGAANAAQATALTQFAEQAASKWPNIKVVIQQFP